jgi:hypothetical protein
MDCGAFARPPFTSGIGPTNHCGKGLNVRIPASRWIMAKLTIIVKKNAGYERGDFGYSVHEEGAAGMTANVVPSDEAGVRKVLKDFGCTDDYVDDVIIRLNKKHDSVKVVVEKPT